MKTISGYFGGYISKKQKVGNFEIRNSVRALPLFFQKLRNKEYKHSSAHLAQVTNRMFTVLEPKGVLRMAPEEFMLSSMYKAHDPLSAEFIRTFRHEFFYRRQLLERYEYLQTKVSRMTVSMLLPKVGKGHVSTDAASLYGFRPQHSDSFYLSPWEFCQWFKAVRLERPSATYDLSIWTPAGRAKLNARAYADLQPVEDYIFDDRKGVCFFGRVFSDSGRLSRPTSVRVLVSVFLCAYFFILLLIVCLCVHVCVCLCLFVGTFKKMSHHC